MISRKNAKILFLASLCGLMIATPFLALAAGISDSAQFKFSTCVKSGTTWIPGIKQAEEALNAFPCVVYQILYLIFSSINYFTAVMTWLMQLILGYTSSLTSLPTIKVGFEAMLSVANLIFVFAIIVIAISTILDYERYGMKSLLWKLIVAAILVNFSFLFAGIIVNVSNGITFHFINRMTGSTADHIGESKILGDKLAAAFNPESLVAPSEAYKTADQGGAGFFATVQAILFGILFAALIFFVMAATMIMFLIRYIYIAFLLILAPTVWALWIFPSTAKHFERWWSEFLRWCFFAPVCIFFLYLAMYTSVHRADYLEKDGINPYSDTSISSDPTSAAAAVRATAAKKPGAFQRISDMMIILGLAYGGLIAANAFGIQGAQAAMGMAQNTRKRVQKAAVNRGRQAIRTTADLARTSGKQYNAETKETTTAMQRFGSSLQGIAGFRGIGSKIARQGKVVEKTRPEDIEKYRKDQLESLDQAGFLTRAKGGITGGGVKSLSPIEVAAIAQEAARRNLVKEVSEKIEGRELSPEEITDSFRKHFIETAERMGNADTIYANRPELTIPRRDSRVDAAIEEFKGLGDGIMLERAQSAIRNNNIVEMAAAAEEIARRNIYNNPTAVQIGPDLEKAHQETQDEAIDRTLKKVKGPELAHQSLGNSKDPNATPNKEQQQIALGLKPSQLSRLAAAENNGDQVEALRHTLMYLHKQNEQTNLPEKQLQALKAIEKHFRSNPNLQALPGAEKDEEDEEKTKTSPQKQTVAQQNPTSLIT